MLKNEYFLKAVKAGKCCSLDWLLSILTYSEVDHKPTYDYCLYSDNTGHYVKIPMLDGTYNPDYVKLEDAIPNQRPFTQKDVIDLMPGDLPNVTENIRTTIGRVIANYVLLVHPFNDKIPFINKKFNAATVGDIIKDKLKDDPKEESDRKPNEFYVSELLKLAKGGYFLEGISQAVTWGLTEKIMLPPPGIAEYKQQLFQEYAGRLSEAAVIAEIDAKLLEFYKEYIKGDEGLNFLISKKSINVVAKKKFLMHGAEVGLDGNTVNVELVKNSLYEGWDPNNFAAMNNSLRLGSYARGAETMLGGVEVKWMQRASSNLNVIKEDCGTKLGKTVLVTQETIKDVAGFNILENNENIYIEDKEQAGAYLGKVVTVRSPMYCRGEKTDYCTFCLGKRLSATPTALSSAVSAYGSVFLLISLANAHAKALELAEMDLESALF